VGSEATFTMLVVFGVLITLITTSLSADVVVWAGVALLMLAPLPAAGGWKVGVLSTKEALGGLSNEGMITVAVLFIVAAGIRETGAMAWVASGLLGRAKSVSVAQARVLIPTTALSAFLNNTPLVAILLPVITDWAKRNRISPSKLLMPLSYAAILGGTCSMIGTSTNLVVNGMVVDLLAARTAESQALIGRGLHAIEMFEITWVGLPCAAAGILYLLVVGRRLLPDRIPVASVMKDPREYTVEMIVEPGSGFAGKTIEEAGLRGLPGLYLVEIERAGEVLAAVSANVKLQDNDRLVLVGVVESVVDVQKMRGLRPATDQVYKLDEPRPNRVLVEAVVSHTSPLIGRTIRESKFRTVYNAAVIAVGRNGERINKKIGDIVIQPGDTLLVEARKSFTELHRNSREFYLVSSIEDSTPPRHDKAPLALAILVAMVTVVTIGWLSMLQAGIVAAALMIATQCCSVSIARRSLDWQVLLVIAGALSLGVAIEVSGAAGAIAHNMIAISSKDPWTTLALICLITTVFTELITNNAAAALVFPIAMNAAVEMNVNPTPFVIVIMMAASASFSTPIGYQTNLMVYGPGGYRFTDFFKIGIPMNIMLGVLSVLLAPLIWPF
jgi:di/tricarboxylate transporter